MTQPVERSADDVEGFAEVVVAVDDAAHAAIARRLAEAVADRAGCDLRVVHVDEQASMTPAELARAIAASLGPGSLLVVRSNRSSRWSGKYSVAECLLDRTGGTTLLAGPRALLFRGGPVIVALNGSELAERAIAPAERLAGLFSVELVLARVVPTGSDRAEQLRSAERHLQALADGTDRQTCIIRSNDHVSALIEQADRTSSSFLALATQGDRSTVRTTMARTSTGLVNEAGCPVLAIGTGPILPDGLA